MRVCSCCVLLLLSALGIALGQDTNFSAGPQYLLNYGSPQFARPISTPSMSFTERPLEVGASNATGVLIAGAENQTVLPPRSKRSAQDKFVSHFLRRASGKRHRDQGHF